jgi:hypothetical protein
MGRDGKDRLDLAYSEGRRAEGTGISTLGEPCAPVGGDVDPAGDPCTATISHMAEDFIEGTDATRSPDYPQVQADRHHFWRVCAFSMKPIEGIDHMY